MRWWKRRRRIPRDHLFIDHGNVACPMQGVDVDIEHCLVCGAYRDVVTDEEGNEAAYLVCRPSALTRRHSLT